MPGATTICVLVLLLLAQGRSDRTDSQHGRAAAGQTVKALEDTLAYLRAELQAGRMSTADVLTSPAWLHLHENPRFRAVVRKNTTGPRVAIVTTDEPGQPLMVSGTVRDGAGRPIESALLYFFQTGASGSYSSAGGNVADMGDSLNPRIFGYARTGADGRYAFCTIRPGSIHRTAHRPTFTSRSSQRGSQTKFPSSCSRTTTA